MSADSAMRMFILILFLLGDIFAPRPFSWIFLGLYVVWMFGWVMLRLPLPDLTRFRRER